MAGNVNVSDSTNIAEIIGHTLIGATITAVGVHCYDDDGEGFDHDGEGFATVTLKLADGRSYDFTSCSCCGGGDFHETPDKTQHELNRESTEGTQEWERAQGTRWFTR